MARIRGEAPDFTKPCTLSELLKAVNERLPVDKVYVMAPSTTGFQMVEVGELVLQFQPIGQTIEPMAEPILPPVMAPQAIIAPQPTPTTKAKKKASHKSTKAPVSEDSKPVVQAERGTVQVTGFTPGQEPPKGQDPNSHLGGPLWNEN